MIIYYTQALGWLDRAVGVTWFGHASLALTGVSPAVFLSYVVEGKRQFKHDRFKKGSWGDPLYRVQLPTSEDRCDSTLSEQAILDWYEKNKEQNFIDCVDFTRKALKSGGVLDYHPHFWNPVTPGFLACWVAVIQYKMKKPRGPVTMPAEPDPNDGRFFEQDRYKSQNLLPAFVVSNPHQGRGGGYSNPLVQNVGEKELA